MKRPTVMMAVFACAAMIVGCAGSDDADTTVTVGPTIEVTTPATATTPATTAAPADEARPPNSWYFTMAYDATARVVVAVDDNETWWLDPATNLWTRSAAPVPFVDQVLPTLVYSPEVGGVLLITTSGRVASFDVAADAWTVRTNESLGDFQLRRAAALDEPSGDVILLEFSVGTGPKAWRYDVAANAWAEEMVRGSGPTGDLYGAQSVIMVDDPDVDGLVVIISGNDPSPTAVADVWRFDPTGDTAWTPLAPMPQMDFPWNLPRGTEAAYVPSTNRLVVMSGGVTAEYDGGGDEWTLYLNGDVTSDPTLMTGVPRKMSHAMVYEPLNDQVLLYGGQTWTGTDWASVQDMWAYAPASHTWQQLLAPPSGG